MAEKGAWGFCCPGGPAGLAASGALPCAKGEIMSEATVSARKDAASKGRLRARDFATLGIFSALLFVWTMVVGMLMTNPLVLMPWAPAVIALVGGPLYLVMPAKVHKTGAVLVPALVVGIVWALMGGMFVLAAMVVAGLLGELAASATKYRSFPALLLAYVLFCVDYHVGSVSAAWLVSDYFMSFASYPAEIAQVVTAVVCSPNGYLSLVGCAVAAAVGALFGRVLLKKHFVAAGIVGR